MAATRIVEEERGTFTGAPRNPHQGYYAGDFGRYPATFDGFALAQMYAEGSSTSPSTSGWF
jgi:hypothetical protein